MQVLVDNTLLSKLLRKMDLSVAASVEDLVIIDKSQLVMSSCPPTPAKKLAGLVDLPSDGRDRNVRKGFNIFAKVQPGPKLHKLTEKLTDSSTKGSVDLWLDMSFSPSFPPKHFHFDVRLKAQGSMSSLVSAVAGEAAGKALQSYAIKGQVYGSVQLTREAVSSEDPTSGFILKKRLGVKGSGQLDLKASSGGAKAISKVLSSMGGAAQSTVAVDVELDLPLRNGDSLTPDAKNMLLNLRVKASASGKLWVCSCCCLLLVAIGVGNPSSRVVPDTARPLAGAKKAKKKFGLDGDLKLTIRGVGDDADSVRSATTRLSTQISMKLGDNDVLFSTVGTLDAGEGISTPWTAQVLVSDFCCSFSV